MVFVVLGKLGIDCFVVDVLLDDKEEFVCEFQMQGKMVVMVGDGINDLQVLVLVDVSIVMGKGIDIVMDVVMVMLMILDLLLLFCVFEFFK